MKVLVTHPHSSTNLPCSLKANAPICPDRNGFKNCSICCGVPFFCMRSQYKQLWIDTMMPVLAQALDNSSMANEADNVSRAVPPFSRFPHMPINPNLLSLWICSFGNCPARSNSSATGASSVSANDRQSFWTALCSSRNSNSVLKQRAMFNCALAGATEKNM